MLIFLYALAPLPIWAKSVPPRACRARGSDRKRRNIVLCIFVEQNKPPRQIVVHEHDARENYFDDPFVAVQHVVSHIHADQVDAEPYGGQQRKQRKSAYRLTVALMTKYEQHGQDIVDDESCDKSAPRTHYGRDRFRLAAAVKYTQKIRVQFGRKRIQHDAHYEHIRRRSQAAHEQKPKNFVKRSAFAAVILLFVIAHTFSSFVAAFRLLSYTNATRLSTIYRKTTIFFATNNTVKLFR